MSDETTQEDWRILAQVSQVFRSISDTFTDQADMHRGQAVVLCVVAGQDGLTQSEIAEQLSIQGASVTNMLQRMEELGLVSRQRDAQDNRLVRVYATELGRQKEAAIQAQFLEMQAVIFKDLSADDRATLRRLLQQILANMSSKT